MSKTDETRGFVVKVEPQEVLDGLQKFNQGFRHLRTSIEAMDDEQLILLYEQAKEMGQISWFIRCLVIGTAKGKAVKGDGQLIALAKEFGIGVRMAELDVAVYNAFIRDDPDFEPQLPAAFYQIAATQENPKESIELAVSMKAENPKYPSTEFKRLTDGKIQKERGAPGTYLLVGVGAGITVETLEEEARMDGGGLTELYGRLHLVSISGRTYLEVK